MIWTPERDAVLRLAYAEESSWPDVVSRVSREIGEEVTYNQARSAIGRLKRLDHKRGVQTTRGLVGTAPGLTSTRSTTDIPIHVDLEDYTAHDTDPAPPPDENAPPDHGVKSPISGRPYIPRPPRGPTEMPHYIPNGHELGGVSRLTNAAGEIIEEWSKTRVAGAEKPPVAIPESFLLKRASIMRRGDGSTLVEWARYDQGEIEQWEATKAAIEAHTSRYVRAAEPVQAPSTTDSDLMVVYPLGDPHIGMLAWASEVGENFDLKIAERELCECFRQLVARSPAADEAIVVNLGDFFHAENDTQRTPSSGHKLDVDGRHGKVGDVGLAIMRTLIDTALTKHKRVRARTIPGNHDPTVCYWIQRFLKAVYENEPRVTVEEAYNPYQYDLFGKVLLGWCHGDGCKLEALPELMAADVPELWGAALFRHWHTGHRHHQVQKEHRACIVEVHRTLAGRDAWHHTSGYRAGRSLKALAYHREYGLESTVNVGVERVRKAIEAMAA
jgi:hypothetical protein